MKTERSITTHILNLSSGKPASGVQVTLHKASHPSTVYSASTNEDGRITTWNLAVEISEGTWILNFLTSKWFSQKKEECFFDDVSIAFKIDDTGIDYHVPLLLNSYGYSTYRGS